MPCPAHPGRRGRPAPQPAGGRALERPSLVLLIRPDDPRPDRMLHLGVVPVGLHLHRRRRIGRRVVVRWGRPGNAILVGLPSPCTSSRFTTGLTATASPRSPGPSTAPRSSATRFTRGAMYGVPVVDAWPPPTGRIVSFRRSSPSPRPGVSPGRLGLRDQHLILPLARDADSPCNHWTGRRSMRCRARRPVEPSPRPVMRVLTTTHHPSGRPSLRPLPGGLVLRGWSTTLGSVSGLCGCFASEPRQCEGVCSTRARPHSRPWTLTPPVANASGIRPPALGPSTTRRRIGVSDRPRFRPTPSPIQVSVNRALQVRR
jgi:hypothetical protein